MEGGLCFRRDEPTFSPSPPCPAYTRFAERIEPEPVVGHYEFRPKVSSAYLEEIFGEEMLQVWYSLVDAVMAGEDAFACPDEWTCSWVMGQFPVRCFPVLTELITWDYGGAVENGVAHFQYKVPKEECKAKLEEFAALCEDILNQTMADDYSDLEKALSLYRYFTATYVYDYDTYYKMYEEPVNYTSAYRLLTEGTGICHEIATAYSYLLMLSGVDATIMMGGDHEWSYVRINGHNYHVDPTFGLGEPCDLQYFMMTDEKRSEWYTPDTYTVASVYTQEYGAPDYKADDDTFAPLWDCCLDFFDHDTHVLYSHTYSYENGGGLSFRAFDYGGF